MRNSYFTRLLMFDLQDSSQIKLTDLDNLNDQQASQYEEIVKQVHDIVKRLPSANFYTAGKLICHLKR